MLLSDKTSSMLPPSGVSSQKDSRKKVGKRRKGIKKRRMENSKRRRRKMRGRKSKGTFFFLISWLENLSI